MIKFTVIAIAAMAVAATASAQTAPTPAAEDPVVAALRNYAAFQGDIGSLKGGTIKNAAELDRAITVAAGQNKDSVPRGWIAYGAVTAAQQPEFVKSVRETAAFYGKDQFVKGLTLDPSYAASLKGGAEARALAIAVSRADGERIVAVGDHYKTLAYGVAELGWAKAVAPGQPARLAKVKSLAAKAADRKVDPALLAKISVGPASVNPATDANGFGGMGFWDVVGATPGAASATPAVLAAPRRLQPHPDRVGAFNNMTAVAAIYALGASDFAAQTDKLLRDRNSSNCVEIAQVQFNQCVSAARFWYENAFCLAEHALRDMGSCIKGATLADGESPDAKPAAH